MGVVYKLKSEIKDFILRKKEANPNLSCRGLVKLIEEELKVKVSKSSINAVFKESGLSVAVGRRYKEGKPAKSRIPGLLMGKGDDSPESPESIKPIELPEVGAGLNPPYPPISTEPVSPPEPPKPVEPSKPPEPAISEKGDRSLREPSPFSQVPPEPVSAKGDVSLPGGQFSARTVPKAEPSPSLFLEGEVSGAILLKAIDYIIGGVYRINDVIRLEVGLTQVNLLPKTEALVYSRLFSTPPYRDLTEDCPVWTLIHQKIPASEVSAYLYELQKNENIPSQIYQTIPILFKEARGIKVVLSSGTYFYLDSQLHTIWSTPHIPYDFSATLTKIRSYTNRYFKDSLPMVFFMAPGYDIPINEFFEFILSLNTPEQKSITALSPYGHKFEDLEVLKLGQVKKRHFVFGLWPWQFVQYRKVNKIKEFKPFHFEPLKKDFYIAEVEMELLQQHATKGVTLRGAALKASLSEKTRLIILSNFPAEGLNLEELCQLYLTQWPNLEEAFQDYSRKIELFTYTAGAQRIFSEVEIEKFREPTLDVDNVFNTYLKMLDLYLRWYFMPSGYENKDFSTMKTQFYNLKAKIKPENDYLLVNFEAPSQAALLKDLEYTLRRLNEKEVTTPDGKRLWFVCMKPVSSGA